MISCTFDTYLVFYTEKTAAIEQELAINWFIKILQKGVAWT